MFVQIIFVVAFAGFVGLLAGGFLTVAVPRLLETKPEGIKGVLSAVSMPPSHCPACGTNLTWREKFPVIGWIIVRGRCASCDYPVPVTYPLVEFSVALLVIAAALPVAGSMGVFLFAPLAALAIVAAGLACAGIASAVPLAIGVGIAGFAYAMFQTGVFIPGLTIVFFLGLAIAMAPQAPMLSGQPFSTRLRGAGAAMVAATPFFGVSVSLAVLFAVLVATMTDPTTAHAETASEAVLEPSPSHAARTEASKGEQE